MVNLWTLQGRWPHHHSEFITPLCSSPHSICLGLIVFNIRVDVGTFGLNDINRKMRDSSHFSSKKKINIRKPRTHWKAAHHTGYLPCDILKLLVFTRSYTFFDCENLLHVWQVMCFLSQVQQEFTPGVQQVECCTDHILTLSSQFWVSTQNEWDAAGLVKGEFCSGSQKLLFLFVCKIKFLKSIVNKCFIVCCRKANFKNWLTEITAFF